MMENPESRDFFFSLSLSHSLYPVLHVGIVKIHFFPVEGNESLAHDTEERDGGYENEPVGWFRVDFCQASKGLLSWLVSVNIYTHYIHIQ